MLSLTKLLFIVKKIAYFACLRHQEMLCFTRVIHAVLLTPGVR